jgi:hypothetical protein
MKTVLYWSFIKNKNEIQINLKLLPKFYFTFQNNFNKFYQKLTSTDSEISLGLLGPKESQLEFIILAKHKKDVFNYIKDYFKKVKISLKINEKKHQFSLNEIINTANKNIIDEYENHNL